MRKNNQTGRILIKCGADKKVNNFLWRTTQICRYFLTTCTNKIHKDKNIKQMSCYTQETGRSLLPKCSSDAKIFSSDVYKKHTQARKYQADGLQYGRSMVEMLGVLAIIGVLSVGAIAGYQKAMTKYKLNKQATQITQLLTAMHRYKSQFEFNTFVSLNPYLIKLGEVPKEMIRENNTLYDVFGSKVITTTNSCVNDKCSSILLSVGQTQNNVFDTCRNLITIAKEFSDNLYTLQLGKYTEDASGEQYAHYYRGKEFCSKTDCISNLTLNDIDKICRYCDKATSCRFIYQFMF